MTKYFKGDETEVKFFESGNSILSAIEAAINEFYEDVYGSVPMGELLYDEVRVPLTNAIKRDVFIRSFKQIFEAWNFCGTFEAYILVFKKIFGDDVVIDFTVSDPGKLQIDIEASSVSLNQFIAREIDDNEYVYHNVVDHEGDNICFAAVPGLETQHELEKMLFTMVPNGIYTEVSLTIA